VIFLSRVTHWGYRDLMDMDADLLAWWVEQAVDFEKRRAATLEDLNGS
jgi:hypothetical protein